MFFAISKLKKQYNKHTVLANISFQVASTETVALLGASGSGKTTLLRCINLLEMPDEGIITIDNAMLSFTPDLSKKSFNEYATICRNNIGMVFQNYNLWPHLSVLSNLTLAPKIVLKEAKHHTMTKAQHLLGLLGLTAKKDAMPNDLSGGERQRVAIARALMMEPKILLLDEPSAALDPNTKAKLIDLINALSKTCTIIIATHDIAFASAIAKRIIFMEHGIIVEEAKVEASKFIASTDNFKKFLNEEQNKNVEI